MAEPHNQDKGKQSSSSGSEVGSPNPLSQLEKDLKKSLAANQINQIDGENSQAYSQLANAVKNYLSVAQKK